jgi:hypothetical protein
LVLFVLINFAEGATGQAEFTFRKAINERQSSKYQEYRSLPEGISGSLEIIEPAQRNFFQLQGNNLFNDDLNLKTIFGESGNFKVELGYNKLVHRFAFDAKTLYSGIGSGTLTLDDAMQTALQASTSTTVLATNLKNYFANAASTDVQLSRNTTALNFDFMNLNPLILGFEVKNEKREGTRPIFGAFGFGNPIELPEPISYDTNEVKLKADFAKDFLALNATYYFSNFKNNIDTLTWDNPFRITDSTAANAYSQTYASGASKGLMDLAPNNNYQNFTLSGALTDLPLRSQFSSTVSMGLMTQNDPFVAYTTNTAIATGAVTGTTGVTTPFNAYDVSTLPKSSADAAVHTSLYNLVLSSNPTNFIHIKSKYRNYNYENKTSIIEFPGYARFDAVWEPDKIKTEPSSYNNITAGVDLDFDISNFATYSLGYTNDKTNRIHREVAAQDDKIYNASLDIKPLGLRTSYEISKRTGEYDYTVPFELVIEEGHKPAQLPWLRKYDEANRDRERIQVQSTLISNDSLTVTGSLVNGKDTFIDSPFGLLSDSHNSYAVDADYAVNDRISLYSFYSLEEYKNSQKSRAWTQDARGTGGADDAKNTGDPYYDETTYDSNSNWDAVSTDKLDTVGVGINFALVPEKLAFDVNFSSSINNGNITFTSTLGTAANDQNAVTPVDYTAVEDNNFSTLSAKLKYFFSPDIIHTFGLVYEKLALNDYNLNGFEYIPTTSTGAYNAALLMGTLPESYETALVYIMSTFKF